MQLVGKRIVVAGGASGMGAAMVRAFSREGAQVVSMDVDDARGAEVVGQAADQGGGSVRYMHCDVSRGDAVKAAFAEALQWLGALDVVASVAGLEQRIAPEDLTEADLDRMIDVHVKGTMYVNQQAFAAMRNAGGAVINFASVAGVDGAADSAGYAAAKGAVLAWTRSAARQWGRYGIRVNAVCPMIHTPMFDRYRAILTAKQLESYDRAMRATIPLGGKLGDPDDDLAPVMVFLASDSSRFITGQTVPVDGGMLMLT